MKRKKTGQRIAGLKFRYSVIKWIRMFLLKNARSKSKRNLRLTTWSWGLKDRLHVSIFKLIFRKKCIFIQHFLLWLSTSFRAVNYILMTQTTASKTILLVFLVVLQSCTKEDLTTPPTANKITLVQGNIYTIAGTGKIGYSGNGGPALNATISERKDWP